MVTKEFHRRVVDQARFVQNTGRILRRHGSLSVARLRPRLQYSPGVPGALHRSQNSLLRYMLCLPWPNALAPGLDRIDCGLRVDSDALSADYRYGHANATGERQDDRDRQRRDHDARNLQFPALGRGCLPGMGPGNKSIESRKLERSAVKSNENALKTGSLEDALDSKALWQDRVGIFSLV